MDLLDEINSLDRQMRNCIIVFGFSSSLVLNSHVLGLKNKNVNVDATIDRALLIMEKTNDRIEKVNKRMETLLGNA